jgi:CIC family chloride channel protein
VLGVGYDTISDILNNNLALKLLILVAVCKAFVLVVSIGSGTSGGLLAPMFMSSAAFGGVFAMVVNLIWPGAHLSPGAYALVAMAAVFGAASRATFAFIVFAFEITQNYNAILPLMLGCVVADIIALRYLPNSIMTEKLARRGLTVPEGFEVGALRVLRVGELMREGVKPVPAEMTIGELAEHISVGAAQRNGAKLNGEQSNGAPTNGKRTYNLTEGLPIVGADGQLKGVVTQSDLLKAFESDPQGTMTVLDAGSNAPVVAYPDELAFDAMNRMLLKNIGRLPVVSREDPHKMVGYFNRTSILSAWSLQMQEESHREHGWVRAWRGRNSRFETR